MLVLAHYGDPDTAGDYGAVAVFPDHGDPKKARVMKPLLIFFCPYYSGTPQKAGVM